MTAQQARSFVLFNLQVYDTYAGPAGVCYLDFVWHWMWTALRSDPDAAYQHARTLAHHLIPLCAIVADAEPSR